MPVYNYKALDRQGQPQSGEMTGATEGVISERLIRSGLMPVEIKKVTSSLLARLNKPVFYRDKLTRQELLFFTREMASLLRASLSVEKALTIICSISKSSTQKEILLRTLARVRAGATLSRSLALEPHSFPTFYVSMVEAGEIAGALPQIMDETAQYLNEAYTMRETIKSALVYPCILLGMVVLTMVLVVTVILPQFEPIFAQAPEKLPLSTKIVMALGGFLHSYGWAVIILFAAGIVVVAYLARDERMRMKFDRFLFCSPLTLYLPQRLETARFHRMMGTLLRNGVTLSTAFKVCWGTVANRYLRKNLQDIFGKVREGGRLSKLYGDFALFPPLVLEMVRVGEETGNLSAMMIECANVLERESRNLITRLLGLLVPGLTVLMGLIVASLIAAVLAGILSVNEIAI